MGGEGREAGGTGSGCRGERDGMIEGRGSSLGPNIFTVARRLSLLTLPSALRFDVWPYLERFTVDVEREVLAEMGGKPDLVIGNYRLGGGGKQGNEAGTCRLGLYIYISPPFSETPVTLMYCCLISVMPYRSDGNLVATLLCKQMGVTQCNIAHALEKTKYEDADINW